MLTPAAILPATREGYGGVEVSDDRLVFRWSGPFPIWIGAVISGTDARGDLYLREAVSLRATDDGRYEVATRPARLTDLIQRGEFIVHGARDAIESPGQRVSALVQPVFEFDRVGCGASVDGSNSIRPFVRPRVSVGDARVRIAPAAAARCALTAASPLAAVLAGGCHGVLQSFSLAVEGSLDVGATYTATTTLGTSCSLSLLPRGLADTGKVGPLVFVGGVPVQLTLTPDVSLNVSLSRTDVGEVELGARVRFAGSMRYGADSGWTSDVTRPTVEPIVSASARVDTEGSIGVFVNAKFSAEIAGIAGPYLVVSPGFEYRQRVGDGCVEETTLGPAVQVEFGAGVGFQALGFDAGVSVNLVDRTFSFDPTVTRRTLASCAPPTDAGVDASPRDALADRGAPDVPPDVPRTDLGSPDTGASIDRPAPECDAPETRSCGQCGSQQRPCVDGRWGTWSACAGQGACAPGAAMTCAGSAVRITCSDRCAWAACPGYCGDGVCAPGESCEGCDADCRCATGSVCSGGSCVGCGARDQPCCAANTCSPGRTVCYAGTCRGCGALSEPCCTGASPCDAGGVCDSLATGRCQPMTPASLWSTDFEAVSIPRVTGGTRLSNGIEISDVGGPRIGSGPVAGPSSARALAIYGAGSYQAPQSASLTLPVALTAGRDASVTLMVRGSTDGPGDASIRVRRGMCPEVVRTVRRSLGWHQLELPLNDCGLAGTGVVLFIGEYYEFPPDTPALSIDDIVVAYR